MKPYTHTVQYYETDRMDCVHHSNYIRWFEEARCWFLAEIGFSYFRMESEGILSPVLSAEAKYHSMCRFGESVNIDVRAEKYTGSRITFVYTITDRETGTLRCSGNTSHCFIGTNNRPVSVKKHLPQLHEIIMRYIEGLQL